MSNEPRKRAEDMTLDELETEILRVENKIEINRAEVESERDDKGRVDPIRWAEFQHWLKGVRGYLYILRREAKARKATIADLAERALEDEDTDVDDVLMRVLEAADPERARAVAERLGLGDDERRAA